MNKARRTSTDIVYETALTSETFNSKAFLLDGFGYFSWGYITSEASSDLDLEVKLQVCNSVSQNWTDLRDSTLNIEGSDINIFRVSSAGYLYVRSICKFTKGSCILGMEIVRTT